jgi:hypothetical protein
MPTGATMKLNDVLQWVGAVFIIVGHVLNSIGPATYPYNIATFAAGTIFFLTWSWRVDNRPQLLVNIIALGIGATGLYRALT